MDPETLEATRLVLAELWQKLAFAAGLVIAVIGVAHVVLNKRDARAAIGWAGLIVLSPFVGALLYYLFGINRLRRRAVRLASGTGRGASRRRSAEERQRLEQVVSAIPDHLRTLSRAVHRSTHAHLTFDNAVRCLVNGDEAYPVMLEAIRQARRSVAMSTYIFDNDRAGKMFVEALAEAVARGVEVRVLIDGVGARYSRPRLTRALAARGVTVREFLPSRLPWRNPYMNLRNHRKLLIVDRAVGFTGGLNIREGCLLELAPSHPVQDLHFKLEGPVVDQLFAAFLEDWVFTAEERLSGPAWASAAAPAGVIPARGILDGPDEHFEAIRWTMLAALGVAERSVRIATPYFLPDRSLISAIQLAALRGARLEILLPEVNNLRFVQWASMAQLWELLEVGCRVWLTPPPFDHSKLMVVDGAWSLIGSANWDPRSLRLNFEINVECYGLELARTLLALTDDKIARARRLTSKQLAERSLAVRLRDGVARLFSPYL